MQHGCWYVYQSNSSHSVTSCDTATRNDIVYVLLTTIINTWQTAISQSHNYQWQHDISIYMLTASLYKSTVTQQVLSLSVYHYTHVLMLQPVLCTLYSIINVSSMLILTWLLRQPGAVLEKNIWGEGKKVDFFKDVALKRQATKTKTTTPTLQNRPSCITV